MDESAEFEGFKVCKYVLVVSSNEVCIAWVPMATSDLQAFFDFRMRRSLARVMKIRRDRAGLPIAAFQDTIAAAVASNKCVLIAGDTGCGKSTQVRAVGR